MARVNIEDHAFGDPRIKTLAREIRKLYPSADDISDFAAIGMLACLWHETQAEFKTHASESDVDKCLGMLGAFKLLNTAGYLKNTDKGFQISGNEHQIAGLTERKIKARNAAKKRWACRDDAPSMQQACNKHAHRMLGDAQTCTIPIPIPIPIPEENTKKKKRRVPPPKAAVPHTRTEGSQVWEVFCEAMQTNWRTRPNSSAKTAANAKKLVELVGIERAMQLAAYYPTRRKQYYLERGHPFELLLTDYAAMTRELDSGIKMTPTIVKELVADESFRQHHERVTIGCVTADPFALSAEEEKKLLSIGR